MTQLTFLSYMAGSEFSAALDTHLRWGISVMDLKDGIFGKALADLSLDEAVQAAELIRERGLTVYCFSTVLFYPAVELGEANFRQGLATLEHILKLAKIMQPQVIRLLAAQSEWRADFDDIIPYLRAEHPWLIPLYAEAIDRIHAAGFAATIENECHRCIFATSREVTAFFTELDRRDSVHFTWDVQNMWEVRTFPSLASYRELQPLIGYLHLKGGQTDGTTDRLCWASALEDACWPVLEITRHAIADGVPVICLNPSHGCRREGYDYTSVTERDIAYLRSNITDLF